LEPRPPRASARRADAERPAPPARRLTPSLVAPQDTANYCAEGKQPLFSAYMIYQVHLLIFLFAVIHVVYVAGTLLVCLVQVRLMVSEADNVGAVLLGGGSKQTQGSRVRCPGESQRGRCCCGRLPRPWRSARGARGAPPFCLAGLGAAGQHSV
jgi:hypothetical protein